MAQVSGMERSSTEPVQTSVPPHCPHRYEKWAKTSDLECELICNQVGCCAVMCISVVGKIEYGEVKLRAFLVPVVYRRLCFIQVCPHTESGFGSGMSSCPGMPCMLCTAKLGIQ